MITNGRYANTYRNVKLSLWTTKCMGGNSPAQSFGQLVSRTQTTFREDYDELFATQSRKMVTNPNLGHYNPHELLEHCIPSDVTIAVIDPFEVVQIHD